MKRVYLILIVLVLQQTATQAVDKKPLDHSVYDGWKSINETSLSNDGQWLLYVLTPQEGDAELLIKSIKENRTYSIPRANKAKFTRDSRFVVAQIQPFFQETRKAKIAKKKEDEMPQDSLAIISLSDGATTKIPRVKSYQLPEKGDGWLAYQLAKEPAKKDTSKTMPAKDLDADDKNDKDKKNDKAATMVIRRLNNAKEWSFPAVTEYQISKSANRVIYSCIAKDSTQKAGIYVFDTIKTGATPIKSGKADYKQLTWDDEGRQAAFLADIDTSKSKQRFFNLYYWQAGQDSGRMVVDTLKSGFPRHWLVSEDQAPQFSKDGSKLYFGTAPIPIPADTSLVDFETAKLDIWHYQDPLLQTHQVHDLDKELKRTYAAVWSIKEQKFTQLAGVDLPETRTVQDGNAGWTLGLSSMPYRQLLSWENTIFYDLYHVRLADGKPTMVAKKIRGPISSSPAGKYILWFDEARAHWFAYNVVSGKTNNLSASTGVAFSNELNDQPDCAMTYGLLGWTEQDRRVLVYDRYDIWELDPENKAAPRNVTQGWGRQNQTSYRYVTLDPEAKFIKNDDGLLLKTFDYRDKSEGFCRKRLDDETAPVALFHAPQTLGAPRKAKEAETLVFSRSSFVEFPDLWITDANFYNPEKISDANPQQKEYLWGSVELVKWISADGKPLEGLLYKPENFDGTKKYPMIVYFYERNADLLHRYHEPRPSASTVSPVFYASRGYLFFIPDIVYEIGYPGKSAMSCIVSGVQKLIEQGFVDPERIGIQGQSWGGYQVAYLVTHTHLFRCAGAGAPVCNMTSAYGGIRWESGMVRQFQYEHEQSRIGGTLWEKPWHYIENSPLFHVPDVTTPLLITHNDADGAVPYYQSIEFFTALRRLGKPAWLLVYNGEAHNLKERKNRKDLSVRLQQFFDHYLQDAPLPVWMKTGVPAILKGKTWGLELTQ